MFFKIMNYCGYSKIKYPFPFIDIYKINWMKGKQSNIHDHSKYGCIMFLYRGILKENIYKKDLVSENLEKIDTRIHVAPKITYINDSIGFHDVKSLKKSNSIHLYFPKGHKTNTYN